MQAPVACGSKADMRMNGIVEEWNRWLVRAGTAMLAVDKASGRPDRLMAGPEGRELWTADPLGVDVRDDLLARTFGAAPASVHGEMKAGTLVLEKRFEGAPWTLHETYAPEGPHVRWTARVALAEGAFRSCAVCLTLPWPDRRETWQVWAARHDMPKALCGQGKDKEEEWIENAGQSHRAVIPALAVYSRQMGWGLALCKPFETPTPRLRFGIGRNGPGIQVCFDWMALSPQRAATASLLIRGTPPCWRPALEWIHDTHREYFAPRSALVAGLWGGHNCSDYKQTEQEVRSGAGVGLKWCVIHGHFPNYGDYDSQADEWASIRYLWGRPKDGPEGPPTEAEKQDPRCKVTIDMVRETIRLLNKHDVAALPYVQVCGDASGPVTERFKPDRIISLDGKPPRWHETGACYLTQLNADPSLAFGRHLDKMIEGMLRRYEGHKGVCVDQACYDFPDTAHDDGITAIGNKPAYMQRFNYNPRLEWLSRELHPDGVIMANGPVTIEIMRAIDGLTVETRPAPDSRIYLRQFQYLTLVKPMYYSTSKDDDRRGVEEALKASLAYACGYTACGGSECYQDVFDAYVPLIDRLAHRTWIFDPNPLDLPDGWDGGIFRAANGNILVTVVRFADPGGPCEPEPIGLLAVRTRDVDHVGSVRVWHPGAAAADSVNWRRTANGEIQIGPMGRPVVAVMLELLV